MKRLLGTILLIGSLSSFATEIQVKKMSKDGDLDRSFVLKTNLKEKVVIDCQSFIQGLRIGEYESAYNYFLDTEECEGLQLRISNSLKKRQLHCIDVDQDIRADYSCN